MYVKSQPILTFWWGWVVNCEAVQGSMGSEDHTGLGTFFAYQHFTEWVSLKCGYQILHHTPTLGELVNHPSILLQLLFYLL